jgi:hypothetical protein
LSNIECFGEMRHRVSAAAEPHIFPARHHAADVGRNPVDLPTSRLAASLLGRAGRLTVMRLKVKQPTR